MLSSRRSVRRRTAKEISYVEDGTDPVTAAADRAARDKEREAQYAKLQRQKRRKFTRWEKQVQGVGPFQLLKWVRTHEEFYDNAEPTVQQYVQEDSAPMTLEEASQILEAHERRRKRTKDGVLTNKPAAAKAPQAAGKTPATNADKQQNGEEHKEETQSVADSTTADGLAALETNSTAESRLDELKSRYADEEEADEDSDNDNDEDEEAEDHVDDVSNADGYDISNHPTLHQPQLNASHVQHPADDQLSEPEHDLDDDTDQGFQNSGMNMNIDEDAFGGGTADDLI